jgi:hypothetical protein
VIAGFLWPLIATILVIGVMFLFNRVGHRTDARNVVPPAFISALRIPNVVDGTAKERLSWPIN